MRASLFLKIVAVLTAVLAVLTTASCSLIGDENEESTTEPEAVTMEARPVSEEQILDFYNRAVNAIKKEKPGVSASFDSDVRDVNTGDNTEAEALIQFAKNFSEALDKVKETKEYGSDLNDFLPLKGTDVVSRLTSADIVKAEIADVEDDRYSYDVHIVLADSTASGAAANAFDFEADKTEILSTFAEYQDTIEVSDYDVSYNGCEIFARINKETNRVTSLHLVKNAIVSSSVNFTGTLAQLGETDVSFNLQENLEFYDFIWDEPTEIAEE
ncbi:MAG: hypothetical protein IJT44_12665 [Clostridia bacterium]|nr:hypothetical protein [Clostridia bacterium]